MSADAPAVFLRAAAALCLASDGMLERHGVLLAGRPEEVSGSRNHVAGLHDVGGDVFARLRSGRATQLDDVETLLQAAREAESVTRAEDAAPHDGEQDPVTGLGGLGLWERFMAAESARCRQFAHPCTVLVADIPRSSHPPDPDGENRRAQRAAQGLRRSLRGHDLLCRLRPTLFAILAIECGTAGAELLGTRVRAALLDVGLASALGSAVHDPTVPGAGFGAVLLDAALQRMRADRERQRVLPL
ncbi:MAG TPA: hypothetical protein VGN54_09160 [Mycobacteriales bacterium]|jgi:GGDEF domain-containing protein|nr:hypothetical protein [Mycobacteriales bacterium]